MEELQATRLTIAHEEKKIADLRDTITRMKENLVSKIQSTKSNHQLLQSIPGSMEADEAEINDVDQICLRALNILEEKL